jgi:hypothetical protein
MKLLFQKWKELDLELFNTVWDFLHDVRSLLLVYLVAWRGPNP